MRLIRFIPIVFILLEACVDPLQIKLLPGSQKFVVDGLITNEPGPYEVKLSYATSLDNALKKPPVATGSSVWIYDDLNHSEKLSETSPGTYQTSKAGMQGVVGRSYYVRIKTKFGREYESQLQRLTPGGEVTNVSFEFVPNGIEGENPDTRADALKIKMDSKGADMESNLFRWRWYAVYGTRTYPELRVAIDYPIGVEPPIIPKISPDPEPCSGYIVIGLNTPVPVKQKVAECTCCECWPYWYSSASMISHNRIVDGNEFKRLDLGNIIATSQQFFYDKYYIKVEQLSLSEEAYNFWNLVEKQETANGNLFQPNAIKVRGNMRSLTDPDEEVLGLFGVSGVAKKEINIPWDVLPQKLPLDTIKQSCIYSFQDVYTAKPSFW